MLGTGTVTFSGSGNDTVCGSLMDAENGNGTSSPALFFM